MVFSWRPSTKLILGKVTDVYMWRFLPFNQIMKHWPCYTNERTESIKPRVIFEQWNNCILSTESPKQEEKFMVCLEDKPALARQNVKPALTRSLFNEFESIRAGSCQWHHCKFTVLTGNKWIQLQSAFWCPLVSFVWNLQSYDENVQSTDDPWVSNQPNKWFLLTMTSPEETRKVYQRSVSPELWWGLKNLCCYLWHLHQTVLWMTDRIWKTKKWRSISSTVGAKNLQATWRHW